MYVQWGYNREIYSKSNLHFLNGDQYNFTIHDARASDKPDFQAFADAPLQVTIPQYNYRIGFYLDAAHANAIELNFDHAKYVMDLGQSLRITGTIKGEPIDETRLIQPNYVYLEHTDGANFYHLNYVRQTPLLIGAAFTRLSIVNKAGVGVVIPKSKVTIFDNTLDNKFHLAGYVASVEAGIRYYPLKNLYAEINGKGGFANYLNALTIEGGRVTHHFWYCETIGLIGYDFRFGKSGK